MEGKSVKGWRGGKEGVTSERGEEAGLKGGVLGLMVG